MSFIPQIHLSSDILPFFSTLFSQFPHPDPSKPTVVGPLIFKKNTTDPSPLFPIYDKIKSILTKEEMSFLIFPTAYIIQRQGRNITFQYEIQKYGGMDIESWLSSPTFSPPPKFIQESIFSSLFQLYEICRKLLSQGIYFPDLKLENLVVDMKTGLINCIDLDVIEWNIDDSSFQGILTYTTNQRSMPFQLIVAYLEKSSYDMDKKKKILENYIQTSYPFSKTKNQQLLHTWIDRTYRPSFVTLSALLEFSLDWIFFHSFYHLFCAFYISPTSVLDQRKKKQIQQKLLQPLHQRKKLDHDTFQKILRQFIFSPSSSSSSDHATIGTRSSMSSSLSSPQSSSSRRRHSSKQRLT